MKNQKSICDIRQLIASVRNGDQEAFAVLLERYKPLIDASVNRFSSDDTFGVYSEDLRQEACLVFYNSILAYDLDQNEVEFGLFAKICIHNALVSQLRILKRHSEEPMDVLPEDVYQSAETPAEKILQQERIRSIYAVVRKNLSNFEYSVWQMYISGRASADIASVLDTDKRAVDNAIYRIRKKLRALLK